MTAEAWKDARSPALAIVARGDQIETANPTEFKVRSQSRLDISYRVTLIREKWGCECSFFTETKQACIHVLAVRFREGFQTGPASLPVGRPGCERCHSGDVILSGKRMNKSGVVSRYFCRTCGFRFTGRDGFQRRRSDPEKIALALDLYFRGMSVRKVREHLGQVYSLKVSAATIYNWIVHFSKVAAKWMDAQGAKVGERWHVDETVVSVDGNRHYIWNVLDAETRFLLATHVSRDRSMADTQAPLHKAKRVTADRPTEIFTDGMSAYPEAINREFGRRHRPGDPDPVAKQGNSRNFSWFSPHRRVPSIRAPESNNLVERLHGTEKERIKVMRGFDTKDGTAALAEGFRVHYNLVREHQALGTTPGSAAGIAPVGGFRWYELLKMANAAAPMPTPEIRMEEKCETKNSRL
jgi:transposase-like protein